MLFNSLAFLLFLSTVFLLYWTIFNRNVLLRNLFILGCSYFFYGCWDYRFLVLIFISSITDYIIGIKIDKTSTHKKRKAWLILSIAINIGLLGFFKYYNFFVSSFSDFVSFLGLEANYATLNIILPVGISFYTFQTLSYTIDIYRKKISPTKDFIAFFSFVSFFPQLVAGPIEKAKQLLPQFFTLKRFKYEDGIDGLKQILWGMFKKVVVADNIIRIINDGFNNYESASGFQLVLGLLLLSVHFYCDFSGYSDIALGTARLFGFRLTQNFAFPLFSRSIVELWRRWHISLTSWFWEYIYVPLGGSKVNKTITVRNIFVVFLISGLWHGANWTFITFGLFHAMIFTFTILLKKRRTFDGVIAEKSWFPSFPELTQMIFTFCLFSFSLVLFHAKSLKQSRDYVTAIFSNNFFWSTGAENALISPPDYILFIGFTFAMFVFEWFNRKNSHGLSQLKLSTSGRWLVYSLICLITLVYFGENNEFVYFQF